MEQGSFLHPTCSGVLTCRSAYFTVGHPFQHRAASILDTHRSLRDHLRIFPCRPAVSASPCTRSISAPRPPSVYKCS